MVRRRSRPRFTGGIMRIRTSFAVFAGALALGSFIACGGSEKPAETAKPVTSASASASTPAVVESASATPVVSASASVAPTPPPPPKKVAKEILFPDTGSAWAFSLADSADAKKLAYDDCAKKGGKDAKKVEACQKDVETSAGNEGVRFEKDAKGNWFFVSVGKDAKGKEVVYNKVQFEVAASTENQATLTPKGKDTGTKPMAKLPEKMIVDVADEATISTTDPKKGKLVYKKAAMPAPATTPATATSAKPATSAAPATSTKTK
jgi:hypothetical protein